MKDFIKKKLREDLEYYSVDDANPESNEYDIGIKLENNEVATSLDKSKIKIRKGVINNLLVYSPIYDGDKMGAFRLKKVEDGFKIFGSVLYDDFQGIGLGKAMYKYIIKDLARKGLTLYSDDNQSSQASRVWDKLVDMGVAEKIGGIYKSKN